MLEVVFRYDWRARSSGRHAPASVFHGLRRAQAFDPLTCGLRQGEDRTRIDDLGR